MKENKTCNEIIKDFEPTTANNTLDKKQIRDQLVNNVVNNLGSNDQFDKLFTQAINARFKGL